MKKTLSALLTLAIFASFLSISAIAEVQQKKIDNITVSFSGDAWHGHDEYAGTYTFTDVENLCELHDAEFPVIYYYPNATITCKDENVWVENSEGGYNLLESGTTYNLEALFSTGYGGIWNAPEFETFIMDGVEHISIRITDSGADYFYFQPIDTLFIEGTNDIHNRDSGYDSLYNFEVSGFTSVPNAAPTTADSEALFHVTVNGKEVASDQPPVIINDRTLVPIRAIAEALGAEVEWYDDGVTQSALLFLDDLQIEVVIGDYMLYVDKRGEDGVYASYQDIELDVPGQIINSRTLLPLRAVSEATGAEVGWELVNEVNIISIMKQ